MYDHFVLNRESCDTGSWSKPVVAVQWADPQTCVMNSVQWQNPDAPDDITLTFHAGGGEDGACLIHDWVPYLTKSTDGGSTWGGQDTWEPLGNFEPGANLMGPVKNQCILLSNGEVLCPSSNESDTIDTSHFETTNLSMDAWTKRSDIRVATSDPDSCIDMVQPVAFERSSSPGHVYALFRTDCGTLAQAESNDFGHSWPAEATLQPQLPSTSAGFDGVVMVDDDDLDDGKPWWLIAWNNSTEGRTPLTLATSSDEGSTWEPLVNVEDGQGSFAYPFLLQSRRTTSTTHLCYSFDNGTMATMAYARLNFT